MSEDKNKIPINDKGQHHGLWEWYWGGTLMYKRFYHNDKEVGYSEIYWYNGKLEEKKYNI